MTGQTRVNAYQRFWGSLLIMLVTIASVAVLVFLTTRAVSWVRGIVSFPIESHNVAENNAMLDGGNVYLAP